VTPSLPTGPDDITPEWLSEVLAGAGFPRVRLAELERLGETDSLSGFVFRAHLTFESETDAAPSVVVKLPAAREQRSPRLRDWYAQEVGFYRELAADCGLATPRAFHTAIDQATADYVLVLEDFPELTPGENVRGATPAEARAIVQMMAGLHARWWEQPRLRDYGFLGEERDSIGEIGTQLRERVPIFLEHLDEWIEPPERTVYERLPDRFASAVAPLSGSPVTLIHRDLTVKNTLMGGQPDSPRFVVIDWQRCSVGRGVRDLSFFLENSVHGGWEEKFELIQLYQQALVEHGVRGYTLDQLHRDHSLSALVDMAQGVVMWTTIRSRGDAARVAVADGIIRNQLRGITGAAERLGLLELLD
jgi:hypothetical protein